MTAKTATTRIAAAALGAAIFGAVLPATGFAQQADKLAATAKSEQRPAAKAVKPAQRSAAPQNSRTAETPGRQWTIQDALPDHSATMRQYEPPAASGIGRVPLQSGPGTVGFETQTRVNPNLAPDGATIRGQDAAAGRTSSYVGMSLTVPTSDKALNIPVPWGRP